ncbi:class Ib ribonucleoside-diphosphate reductase assembly flavoprotein NrdI [Deinococcus sp. QL22]|uniref:ribonucleotide reductase stimulatory protein n=1 Tax=Deinococcus sp. QL22 TaxID=2939437 RepID=UPI002017297E|nr:class Ib ribonucleoside-diphosphate reductase assembly flavoprotein NrdI [Deinococcus sp. QL22]UQN09677.1 class Ib ribonucleoside-diphosphate reductase assembly flavoprotein NrdI [Deinococcus sp. QL22]
MPADPSFLLPPAPVQILYESMTGNVRRFAAGVQALAEGAAGKHFEVLDLRKAVPSGDFLLMTYTFGSGGVPDTTARFLADHAVGLRGVVASGSFHWGTNFGRAGDLISGRYGVPLVARINKAGTASDRQTVAAWLAEYCMNVQARPTGLSKPRSAYGTLD